MNAHDLITNGVGYMAAAVGISLMLPQVIKSVKTRKVDDLSMAMVVLYVLNCLLWLIYGILLMAPPMILVNGVSLVIGIVQLVLKLRYGTNGYPSYPNK